jgi:hypothetical protein
MPRKPVSYIGNAEDASICRLVKKPYVPENDECITYSEYNEEFDKLCIDTGCPTFNEFICRSHQDDLMILEYINLLIQECEHWKSDQ